MIYVIGASPDKQEYEVQPDTETKNDFTLTEFEYEDLWYEL